MSLKKNSYMVTTSGMSGIRNEVFDFMPPPTRADLSQWFTPVDVARLVAEIADADRKVVLEPSCGSGNLIAACIEWGARHVSGLEFDEETAKRMRDRFKGYVVNILQGDFLAEKPDPSIKYDVVVMNPPYENNQDLLHVKHALNFAPVVVAVLRLDFLAGKERKRELWDKVNLDHLLIFSARPSFDGPTIGAAMSNFCIIKISKKTKEKNNTVVEWF